MAIAATVAAFAVAGMPSETAVARAFTLSAAPQVDPVVTTATQAAGLQDGAPAATPARKP